MRRRQFIAGLGSTAAWPLAASAQQSASPVVGILVAFGPPNPKSPLAEAFSAGVAEGGFIEGRNLSFEYRWRRGKFRQVADFAAELVSSACCAYCRVRRTSPGPRCKKRHLHDPDRV
jgi:putative ABC transport system substrate-binding protein